MNWNQKMVACWGIGQSCIDAETSRAVLINGMGWIPKSQCQFGSKEGNPFMVMPLWLARKKIDQSSSLEISESEKDNLIECLN